MAENYATREDIQRLESHLKGISDALIQLVLIEERQVTQAQRITKVEAENKELRDTVESNRRHVDAWVNRGLGGWAVIGAVWAGITFFFKH